MSRAVAYVAEISHVRETTLCGSANPAYWERMLEPLSLTPTLVDGQAQLFLSAVDSRFKGMPFRELVVGVFVCREAGSPQRDGAYLLHAFQSSRLFAWIERTCFSTPYYFAQIQANVAEPLLEAMQKGRLMVRAEMGAAAPVTERTATSDREEDWRGPIFLPQNLKAGPKSDKVGRRFAARLAGRTQTFPFMAGDKVTFRRSSGVPAIEALFESQFRGQEWLLRADATHAKAKTEAYRLNAPWEE